MESKKIILLAGKGFSTNVVYNALKTDFDISLVILEAKESKKKFLKRRIKRLGFFTTAGQILFQLIAIPFINIGTSKKTDQILTENKLDISQIPSDYILRVTSINEQTVTETLAKLQPDAIVVNGTRIISKKILAAVSCPIINMHAGITPLYRGIHGGYWALVNKDKAHCGTTVHLVDAGIDTGNILYQNTINVDSKDNFITYFYKQLGVGIPMLRQAIADALANKLSTKTTTAKSNLWYHPTLVQYLYYRIVHKIK